MTSPSRPEQPRRIFVLAGTYRQAKDYARENRLEPRDWLYISEPRILLGTTNPRIERTGTWYERRDLHAIESVIATNARKEADR